MTSHSCNDTVPLNQSMETFLASIQTKVQRLSLHKFACMFSFSNMKISRVLLTSAPGKKMKKNIKIFTFVRMCVSFGSLINASVFTFRGNVLVHYYEVKAVIKEPQRRKGFDFQRFL